MKYSLAVFDLDGTILDTLEDLTDSLNYALARHSLPERSLVEVRSFVGNGIAKLMQRGVPENTEGAVTNSVHRTFTEYYQQHCYDKTRPYPGIMELLGKLKAAGCRLAVVSNKGDAAVAILIDRFFPGLMEVSVGERQGVRRKPAPDTVLQVLEATGAAKKDAVYIGDSEVDIQTAKNSGLDCISVDWGFRDRAYLQEQGAEIVASSPGQLLELIIGR